jgi:endoglucanase
VENRFDTFGNLLARSSGRADFPNVLLLAHVDEIGFITTVVTPKGFLKFRPLGTWWNQVLLGQRVTVKASQGDVLGVIGAIPPHVLPAKQREQPATIEDMFIDVGAKSDAEAYQMGIRPGTSVVPRAAFELSANGQHAVGKALDDRVGLGVMLESFREAVVGRNHPNVLTLAATVQEETGSRGARTLTHNVRPDLAFALEGILAGDIPGLEQEKVPGSMLGGGVIIVVHDEAMLPNPKLVEWVIQLAESEGIRHQLTAAFGSNDAGQVHLMGEGVPTLVLGVPCRYIHSYSGLMDLNDYEEAIRLVTRIIERADQKVVKHLSEPGH